MVIGEGVVAFIGNGDASLGVTMRELLSSGPANDTL